MEEEGIKRNVRMYGAGSPTWPSYPLLNPNFDGGAFAEHNFDGGRFWRQAQRKNVPATNRRLSG